MEDVTSYKEVRAKEKSDKPLKEKTLTRFFDKGRSLQWHH